MDTVILLAFIWVPGPLTLIAYVRCPGFMKKWTPDWTKQDQEWWHELRVTRHRPGAATPSFVLKDIIETPCWLLYIPLLLTGMIAIIRARHDIHRLKKTAFGILISVLLILRCLGTFSGTLHWHENIVINIFPTNSTSVFKGIILHLVCGSNMWSHTFLGYYDAVNQALWSQTRMEPFESDRVALNIPWRDNFVRLAYYHVIDSILHVFCLRFFWSFDGRRPYTSYMNNEEIVTVLFVVLMVVWMRIQFRTREIKDMREGPGVIEKLEV